MVEPTISLAQSPRAWRRTAIGLKRSADIIWEQWFGIFKRFEGGQVAKATTQEAGDLYLLIPPFLLLYGLAFENALKGLLISNDPSIVLSVIKWDIKNGGHNLRQLYKESGLFATSQEQELLDDLTQAVLWAGRYPVPKNHADKSDFPIPIGPYFRGMNVTTVISCFSDLKNSCDTLFSRILNKYLIQKDDET